ncbi:MAG: tetratricopeptide repeat protein, partial [Halothiobacillaceae bacterium]
EAADVGDAQRLVTIQGLFLSEAGRHAQAYDLLTEALTVWPDSVDFRQQRALVAERLDRLDVVESDLRHILARDPDDPDALNALGYTLADRTDRHDEALELIERAVAIDDDNPAYIDSLGWVYFRLGRIEDAIVQLQKAFEMQPDPEIGAHLGEAYWSAGDFEAARSVWNESLTLDADHHVLRGTLERLAPDMLETAQ